jgi:hypothetical protein
MPLDQFTHNNMVPFFGGSMKQDTRATNANASVLESFTGVRDGTLYQPKQAHGALFTPQDTRQDLAFGAMGDDIRDAYLATMPLPKNRAHEQPAPELVGRPGVANGETGDVYYDQRRYTGERSVDQMRVLSNPKTTFGGRMLPGATFGVDRPTVGQATKQHTVLIKQTSAADLLPAGGALTAARGRPTTLLMDTARQITGTRGYVGPGGSTAVQQRAAARARASHSSYRAVLRGPQAGPAQAPGRDVTDYGKSGVSLRPTARQATEQRTYQHQGLLATAVKKLIAPLQDMVRVARKEVLVDAPRAFGNIQQHSTVQPKLTVYDANDVARTTLKETGIAEAPLANMRLTSYKSTAPEDPARTARKEMLLAEAPLANMRLTSYKPTAPEDPARTARKETLLAEAAMANLYGGNVRHMLTVHDSDDLPRTSMKETMLRDGSQDGVIGATQHQGPARSPGDVARATTRNTLMDVDGIRNTAPVRGAASAVQDPDAWQLPATHRDMARDRDVSDGVVASAVQRRGGAYATTDAEVARTQRETLTLAGDVYGSATSSGAPGGYGIAPREVRDTQRQALSDTDYYGPGGAAATGGSQVSHASAEAMTVHLDKEVVAMGEIGRGPTLTGPKAGANVAVMGEGAGLDPQRETTQFREMALGRPVPGEAIRHHPDCSAGGGGDMGDTTVDRQRYGEDSGDRFDDSVQGAQRQLHANPFAMRPLSE